MGWGLEEIERFRAALTAGLAWIQPRLGFEVGAGERERLVRYACEVVAANEEFNLTRITEPEAVAWKHVIDSLLGMTAVGRAPGADAWLADLGAGAGLPGVVLGIAGGWNCLEVESVRKKAAFLRKLAPLVSPARLVVWEGRAERLGREPAWREQLPLVVARAVGRLDVVAEYALPLLRVGGVMVAYKGPEGREEVGLLEGCKEQLGIGEIRVVEEELPEGWGRRMLVVAAKSRNCDPRFPRREGIPEKRPLGDGKEHR
ncbi:MAG: 16S rRNA (guanine(527)-N(7))-methyltransferase RsmG [Limnochordales bacterium]|nr:16S rRNA (guanine(527)-N(7))-methyltransferase RsmG [Limnochordales bacterium]